VQNPSTDTTTAQATFSGEGTPEIREALRTLRSSEFRLEADYFHLDVESRFELAAELRATLDDLTDPQADEVARVINDLGTRPKTSPRGRRAPTPARESAALCARLSPSRRRWPSMPNTSATTTSKANAGAFRKGSDPRRHVCTSACTHPRHRFTREECSAGFWTAIAVLGVSIGPKLHKAGRWPNFRRQGRRRTR
jgi:hypothetical protein